MKITLTISLSDAEQHLIGSNSIERIFNNAIRVGSAVESHPNPSLSEDASTLWQDCEELKPITTKLWNEVRNAIFLASLKKEPK